MSEERKSVADSVTHLSLCSGYGGLDLGIKRVIPRLRTIAYVEREITACEILGSQMEKGNIDLAPIWSDLKTFPAEHFRGMVDIISGGYPCQPFSVAGRRRGTEDPRHLWPYIREIVETIQPRICVFENVRGHVRLGLSEVLGELRELGYRVRAGIFAASEVGAPHRRERVFILAYLPSSGLFSGAQRRGSGLVNPQGITEREQDDKTSTEPRQDAWSMPGGGRAALANSLQPGLQGHTRNGNGSHEPGRIAQGQDGSASASGLLDDSDSNGYRGRTASNRRKGNQTESPEQRKERDQTQRQRLRGHAGFASEARWPSRPGEPQHEWEEPRTIDRKLNPAWVAQLMGLPSDWVDVHGLSRESKLRALGNGVIPQQAEYAIRTLLQQGRSDSQRDQNGRFNGERPVLQRLNS